MILIGIGTTAASAFRYLYPKQPLIAYYGPAFEMKSGEWMRPLFAMIAVLCLTSPFCLMCPVSSGQAPSQPGVILRSSSRLVVVDVVVRDAAGAAVRGLTEQDFHVKEDGRPQTIRFFNEHAAATATVSAAREDPRFPYANVPHVGVPPDANILLFDLLNTPTLDQTFARSEMIRFLKTLPDGRQTALFVLTDRMRMVQSFTGDASQLRKAAEDLLARPTAQVSAETDRQRVADTLQEISDAQSRAPDGGLAKRLGGALAQQALAARQVRVQETFEALAQITRAAIGYPGRKNLIWLAGEFPTGVSGRLQFDDPLRSDLPGVPAVAEINRQIASTQIAVYPISVLGLESRAVTAAANGEGEVDTGGRMGDTLGRQFERRSDQQLAMNSLAAETGGHAFYETNDVAHAIGRSMDEGAHYYTLAYHPDNQSWNGHYRKIDVELRTRGYTLAYRHGYFAAADGATPDNGSHQLISAFDPLAAEATMLRLRASQPVVSGGHSVQIAVLLDPEGVGFRQDGELQRANLVVGIQATPASAGTATKNVSTAALNIGLDPQTFAAMQRNGIPFRESLVLTPGTYVVRIGVSDPATRRVGTVDLPVTVP
jgi:VWFA-related protein